MKYILQTRY